ncbi:hypothetical protein A3C60_01815 [Candidatus Nomurabacteria bacterium RIFCSPHIGHO2_02_FULL_37_45]|uniref:Uncharacterized protein n=1 Tax=Candidatus Nomurabacteria bacterium RIFCSPHIGHO2_12_FULL_37_29 TaxID=1801759 RepID=A0A1F6WAB0_9BACT|nr:MAG: hypothetical protein A2727_02175 [Candidatus Nomurabacteria bacterium RIFCSPHIGHO2_01_FULL_37_110]OGI71156.1 MAG: hypothetical protein A3C60_01815 [Candidatus Nomurabacteria bacterium RIFCSPHIGHO2_02_FULL_37_45]OGI78809.1 MAG: hypothetical protein A3F19_00830 [Candidatus Nomurabacteria bacterium RIFCSPHIGHO2_12_FULL_37_29]OGI85491.1 MAG: hypothetical protein A3A92_02525 [Candidatus Nomurabacteria bacterium RIFCSPLOWO2_01_FULL_37_49]
MEMHRRAENRVIKEAVEQAFSDRDLQVPETAIWMLVNGYVSALFNWDTGLSLPWRTLGITAKPGVNIPQAVRESLITAPAKIDNYNSHGEMRVSIEGDNLRIYQEKPTYPPLPE